MKTIQRPGKAAFTLIELLAVIVIIVILAAVVVGSMGYVSATQAVKKAQVQISLLSKALEDYKLENGSYPATTDTETGMGQSKVLYNALFLGYDSKGNAPAAGAEAKIYLMELDPKSNKQGWTTTTSKADIPPADLQVTDPWGNEYRYRSAYAPPGGGGTASKNASTQNPEFDLWTAGKDGKSSPASPAAKENKDDIRNF